MVFHCFSHENHQKLTTSDRLPAIQRGEGEAVDEETEGHRLETVLPKQSKKEASVMADF